MPNNPKGRTFTFTCFGTEEEPLPDSLDISTDGVVFYVYQREICPRTKREHFQGFIHMKYPVGMTNVKTHLHRNSAHIEFAHGTFEQNLNYCTKTGVGGRKEGTEPFRFGQIPVTKRARDSIQGVLEMVKEGEDEDSIQEAAPETSFLYQQNVGRLLTQRTAKELPQRDVYVAVYVGDTGTGKTHTVFEDYHGMLYSKSSGDQWFDGYTDQPILLIDDFHGERNGTKGKEVIPLDSLLKWLDRYCCRLQIKCGSAWAKWKQVIITSNVMPQNWYPSCTPEARAALMDRIHEVRTFHGTSKRPAHRPKRLPTHNEIWKEELIKQYESELDELLKELDEEQEEEEEECEEEEDA